MSTSGLWTPRHPVLMGTSFINILVKRFFPMGSCIVLVRSCPVVIISECTLRSDPLAVIRSGLDSGSNMSDQPDNKSRTALFLAAKCGKTRRALKHLYQSRPAEPRSSTWRHTKFNEQLHGPASLRDYKCPSTRAKF